MWWLHVIGAKLGAAVDWIIGLVLELVEEVRGIVIEDRPSHSDSPDSTKPDEADRDRP